MTMTQLPKMVSYYNSQTRISILVPENWTGQVISQAQFRIFGLPEPGFEDYFDEYRSTMSYTLATPTNTEGDWFSRLVEESNQEMAKDYNEYRLVKEEYCEIANRRAYLKYYQWREESTGLQLSQLQSLIRATPFSFYLINAATLKPIEEKYQPIFDAILQSTRIIPARP